MLTEQQAADLEAAGLSIRAVEHYAASHASYLRACHAKMVRKLEADGEFEDHCLQRAIGLAEMQQSMERRMIERIKETKPPETWDAEMRQVDLIVMELMRDEVCSL